jgi:FkbM family methyltransferase
VPILKLKSLLYVLGWRPAPRKYGCEVRTFDLPVDGRVEYAQWLHPRETPKIFRQEVIDELRRFLRPGDVAIDIGAHTGDSTIPIAVAVGPQGRVLALEPNPYVFPVLERNSQLNVGRTAILPLPFAATAVDGSCEFEYSDPGFCNGGRHEGISVWRHASAFRLSVPCKNLMSWLEREHPDLIGRIRYVKVDAEGYDLAVLETLTRLIDEQRPYLKAEVYRHSNRAQRERLLRFLRERRYVVHHVDGDACYLGERVDVEGAMRWRHFDVFCIPEEEARASAPTGQV